MQTIGSHTTKERYQRLSVKVRILREIQRRIIVKDWTFLTVNWGKVQREPIPEEYDGQNGPVLALLSGFDSYALTGHHSQNTADMVMEFAILPGDEEEPSDVLELIAADLVQLFGGEQKLEEGGKGSGGETLTAMFEPVSFETETTRDDDSPCVRGFLTFKMIYRHLRNNPFGRVGA